MRALTPREGSAPVRDRLLMTLFIAALLHGMLILGLTFSSGIGRQDVPLQAVQGLHRGLSRDAAVQDRLPEEGGQPLGIGLSGLQAVSGGEAVPERDHDALAGRDDSRSRREQSEKDHTKDSTMLHAPV